MAPYHTTSSDPFDIGVLLFEGQGLLTPLLWISALLCPIKIEFSMPLRHALGRFIFELHKNRMPISQILLNLLTLYLFQHRVHLIVRVKVTLIDAEGQRSQKMNTWSYLVLLHLQTSYLITRHNTIINI